MLFAVCCLTFVVWWFLIGVMLRGVRWLLTVDNCLMVAACCLLCAWLVAGCRSPSDARCRLLQVMCWLLLVDWLDECCMLCAGCWLWFVALFVVGRLMCVAGCMLFAVCCVLFAG